MSEPSFKVFSRQADRLYERGVAAARGGQRTVAAGLLRQAVRLNPQHEHAWLWLSGTLDDPKDIAFCLRAVLGINPQNKRAEMGLRQIEQQLAQAAGPAPDHKRLARAYSADAIAPPSPAPLGGAPTETPWWMAWRDARTTWRWTLRLVWALPVLLLAITLCIRGVILMRPLPKMPTYQDFEAATLLTATPLPLATTAPVVPTTAAPVEPQSVHRYIGAVLDQQRRLKQATESYRKTSEQSRTTVERVAAARALRDELSQGQESLEKLKPPQDAARAHATYLDGLALEGQAVQDLLTFYSSRDVSAANRAALRLQDARAHIADGKAGWEAFRVAVEPAPGASAAPESGAAR